MSIRNEHINTDLGRETQGLIAGIQKPNDYYSIGFEWECARTYCQ